MPRNLIPAFALVAGALALEVHAADVCALLSAADAARLLGRPVSAVTPAGPQRDDDSGGKLSYCTYRSSDAAFVVSVVEFSSPEQARKQLDANLVKDRMAADGAQVSEEAGVGEKAFWGASEKGASLIFLKKNSVVGLGLGGAGVTQPASRKQALRDAASGVAAKL